MKDTEGEEKRKYDSLCCVQVYKNVHHFSSTLYQIIPSGVFVYKFSTQTRHNNPENNTTNSTLIEEEKNTSSFERKERAEREKNIVIKLQ